MMCDENKENRKPYEKPAIIYEQELETRAGSPVSRDFDPLDLNSGE
jgi:hypothetical protein